jgi:F0F1-type ATP synthase delta subunit
MTYEEILAKVLENTYTKQELVKRVRILKSYIKDRIFSSTVTVDNIDASEIEWLSSLEVQFLNFFNKYNIDPIFKTLDEEILKVDPLTVYLAFEPDKQSIRSISHFLKEEYGRYILIDIKFDPNLIAGCALVWKGIYRDYSLRAKITSNRDEIIASFRRYVKS